MSHTQSSKGHSRLFNMEIPRAIRDEIQRTIACMAGAKRGGEEGGSKARKGKVKGAPVLRAHVFA